MKLLWCKNCRTVINLTDKEKKCECGKIGGNYTDKTNAVYWGKDAVPFAIDNYSFFSRINNNVKGNEVYDSWHGKGKIQCWLLEEGEPNFSHIKKVKKPREVKPKRRLGRCG